MSIVPPQAPSYAQQSTSMYVKKKDVKKTRKKAAYANRRVMKANPRYTRAGVQKLPAPKIALKVSDCSMRYMAALCNPFLAEPGACVPCDLFPLPSQKIRAFTRGSFQLSTSHGVGFILAAPCSANNTAALAFTTAGSIFDTGTLVNSTITNNQTQLLAGLPYTTAQVSALVQARVVSMGLRIRYAGTEASRSGTIVAYEDQDHQGLGSPGGASTNYNSIQLNTSAMVSRPSGDGAWDACVCSSGPCTPLELEFSNNGAYPHVPTTNLIYEIERKVIAQQDQIIFSALSEEEQTEIGYFNLNKFKIRQWNNHKPLSNDLSTENGFKDGLELGFQKAQELLSDRMFTLEDISKIFVGENEKGGLFDDYLDYRIKTNNKITFKEWYLTQTPSQKSWKIECVEENGKVKILKLLNNE